MHRIQNWSVFFVVIRKSGIFASDMNKKIISIIIVAAGLVMASCRDTAKQPVAQQGQDERQETFFDNSASAEVNKQKQKKKSKNLELPARSKGGDEIVLHRKGYTVSYDKQRKTPRWVAWHLTADHAQGDVERHENLFHDDLDVPSPRATDNDYYNSGYDRGHMCPAGDNKWSRDAMNETFLFTNICPQVHGLNAGAWNDLELACRSWARKYGDVYIACGPIYEGTPRTIGRNRVAVPTAFFKVILCMRGQGAPKSIGFIYPNASTSRKMFSYAMSVDEVERRTGIDFFTNLEDNTEEQVEHTRGYF